MKLILGVSLLSSGASLAMSGRVSRGATVRMASEPLASVTGFANMDQAVLGKYMALDTGDAVQAEYVFIDADRVARSKCRTLTSAKAKGPV